jgi:hypothetical protein
VGCCYRIAWRSRVPYPIEFEFTVERMERPALMEGRAEGALSGHGRWRLLEEGGVTAVLYEWNVATPKRWMNLVAPVARPVFAWNHDVVMRWGGEGLARQLGVPLLARGDRVHGPSRPGRFRLGVLGLAELALGRSRILGWGRGCVRRPRPAGGDRRSFGGVLGETDSATPGIDRR